MKKSDETANYLSNKKEIFIRLIDAIDSARIANIDVIYIKKIKILEEEVDIIAKRDEWTGVLQRATKFFEGIEDYEMCVKCRTLQKNLCTQVKKKQTNGKTTKRTTKNN